VTSDVQRNRQRQRELYGAPLAERVHRLTAALRISQAQLAAALGLSPAMLSQLVSGRRARIGDPAVLARLLLLDQRVAALPHPVPAAEVAGLLGEPAVPAPRVEQLRAAADALRRVSEPARLAAAAVALAPGFPELAAVLRAAAGPVRGS